MFMRSVLATQKDPHSESRILHESYESLLQSRPMEKAHCARQTKKLSFFPFFWKILAEPGGAEPNILLQMTQQQLKRRKPTARSLQLYS